MFTPQEKSVYYCTVTKRSYDPLAVKRALAIESKGKFNEWVAAKTPEAEAALVACARKVFGLAPVAPDGSGVLDADVLSALTKFTVFLKGKGPRVQTLPTSAPSTVGPTVGSSPTTTSSC